MKLNRYLTDAKVRGITPLSNTAKQRGLFFQPKFSVNQPNDSYEQEADAVADQVMRMTVQRKCAACGEEDGYIQRQDKKEKKKVDKATASTKVEVVTKADMVETDEGKKVTTTTSGTTTNTVEQKIAGAAKIKVTEKTAGDKKTVTADVKAQDKSSGLSATAGIKSELPAAQNAPNTTKGYLKVEGDWTPVTGILKVQPGVSFESDFEHLPKVSLDGKILFLPNGVVSPELVARVVFGEDSQTLGGDAGVNIKFNDFLSAKVGATVQYGLDNKLTVSGAAGITIKYE